MRLSRPGTVAFVTVMAIALLGPTAVAQGTGGGQDRPGGQRRGGPVIGLFDTDRDGTLSAAEIEAAAAKLRELDRNRDGKITADELPAGPGRAGPGRGGPGRAGPGGPGRGGPGGRRGGAATGAAAEVKPPTAKNDAEKKILAALEEIRKGPRYANVSPSDGRLLRQMTEALGAKRVVEIGTSTGYSGVWFALALRTTGGKLYTHEINEERAGVARKNFKMAGVDDIITIIMGDAHETVKQHKEPIDLLFLDADKEGYIDYLEKLLPLVRPGGLIMAHNMVYPRPDPRYLEFITTHPDLETSFVLMEGAGIGVTLKKR